MWAPVDFREYDLPDSVVAPACDLLSSDVRPDLDSRGSDSGIVPDVAGRYPAVVTDCHPPVAAAAFAAVVERRSDVAPVDFRVAVLDSWHQDFVPDSVRVWGPADDSSCGAFRDFGLASSDGQTGLAETAWAVRFDPVPVAEPLVADVPEADCRLVMDEPG